MTNCLLLDCDGVLADTERHGHLPSFNEMFASQGFPVLWNDEEYLELLKIGGGKERLATLFDRNHPLHVFENVNEAEIKHAIADMHQQKTTLFRQKIMEGLIPPRPGVRRLINEAIEVGWKVAVVSTSAEESVRAVLENAVGIRTATQIPIFAGDLVERKKPAPDIYLLAIEELKVNASQVVAIEDSNQGLSSATAAGLATVTTPSSYTAQEDFSKAVLVATSLGEPGSPATVIQSRTPLPVGDPVVTDTRVLLEIRDYQQRRPA